MAKPSRAPKKAAARRETRTRAKAAKPRAARPKLTLVKGKAGRAAARKSRQPAPKLRALPAMAASDPEPVVAERASPASKQHVLLTLLRSRAELMAVLDGLAAADAERPIAPGKWCVREIVLHLALRDRARLGELESTQRGVPCSWTGFTLEDWKEQNARDMKTVAHLNWSAALALLTSTRQELIEALDMVPDEPAEMWNESHAFGAMLMGLPPHDVHHGEQVRRWRAERGV